MSGITAVFDRGSRVQPAEFDPVFDTLAHRGRDGADTVFSGRVALGHQHFYTVPEEVGERQPISVGDRWITFDGRIDNRADVLELLPAVDGRTGSDLSDAELVLRAYRARGDECLAHLVGAFALAIWDEPDERLLLARDKTGIRELYYADMGDVVVASSEMHSILEHPAVSGEINEGFIGELLSTRFVTPGETYYADIRDVRDGWFVEITAGRTREERYWEIGDAEIDRSKDPVEEFLARFREAVACRLRSTVLPGVMMSGGLDSTAIACLARQHLDERAFVEDDLHSFSIVLEGVDYFEDELDRIEAVVDACRLRSHTLCATDHYALEDIEFYENAAREVPCFGVTLQAGRTLYEQASDAGRNVLLAGTAGNTYDGNRLYYLDLFRERRFGTFIEHARADPLPLRYLLLWFVLAPSSDRLAEFATRRYGDGNTSDTPEWLDPEFVERTGLADRLGTDISTGIESASNELQFKRYFRTVRQFGVANERRVALEAGVDLRNPYLDSRLLEYAMALPAGILQEAERDKSLFRRATEGILPDSVRTQNASVHFGPLIDVAIEEKRSDFFEELFAESRLVKRGIVDEAAYRDYVDSLLDRDSGRLPLWELVQIELWLRQQTRA